MGLFKSAPNPTAPEPGPAGGARAGRARPRALAWSIGLALGMSLALLAALVLGLAALLHTTAGSRWLVGQLPGVKAEGIEGGFLADGLRIARLHWASNAGRLEVTDLSLQGLVWRWRPSAGQWLGLEAERLAAGRVHWRPNPDAPASPPLTRPAELRLPLAVRLPVAIAELQLEAQPPVLDLQVSLALGEDGGRRHALRGLSLRWNQLQAEGWGTVASDEVQAIDALLMLRATEDAPWPWQAAARLAGTLERIELVAGLEAAPAQDRAPAELTLRASVEPFHRWPLAALEAETEALDLAVLDPALPASRLSGRVTLQGRAMDRPMAALVDLRNANPGRWDQGRLPLARAELQLQATPTELDQLSVPRFELALADAQGSAGRVRGQGRWRDGRVAVEAEITDLQPERLDARAAPMRLAGPAQITLEGLKAPDQAAGQAQGPLRLGLGAQLQARVLAGAPTLQLELELTASSGQVELRRLRAGDGQAWAELGASARLHGGRWQLRSEGRLENFDPLPWWPGPPGSAWRRGGHRLNADWALDLRLPADAQRMPPARVPLRLVGQGRLQLRPSTLAGVPVQAELTLDQATAGPEGRLRSTRVTLAAEAGGNRLDLQGQALPLVDGSQDRWRIRVAAPKVQALGRLVALAPGTANWTPTDGSIDLEADVQGRWPQLDTRGRATVSRLATRAGSLDQAEAQWQLSADPEAPLALLIEAQGLHMAGLAWPQLGARAEGSWSRHELRLDLAVEHQPPPALAKALALDAAAGTRLALRGQGAWRHTGAGSSWQGSVHQLAVGGWDGRSGVVSDLVDAGWLDARGLRAELEIGPDWRLRNLHAHAGRATLAGGIGLRWDDLLVDLRASTPALRLQARVEPFAVAPFLARWQPQMRWAGDLQLGASLDIRAAETFAADIVFERERGDLRVLDGADRMLPLGLSDLRVALGAQDGQWIMTAGLAGRTLGELGGIVQVQASARDRWPAADAPLEGSVLMRVGDLGVWGTWVPPGWRLAGSVETSAVFGGRLGAPEVTGELRGRDLAVRNVLQGVHLTDGQVDLRLQGETARLERFTLRGGDGQLRLAGDARLGAQPSAKLSIEAEQFQLLGRIDRRLVASGQAELKLDAQRLDLRGRMDVERGLFDISRADAPTLDADVVVRRGDAATSASSASTSAAAPRREIKVALVLGLGDELVVRGRGLDTRLGGQLRISAPSGRLAVHGVVQTVGGTYAAYGQRMNIERGIVSFAGPVESPQLDVLALRPKLDVEVGVAITGNAQTPRVRLHANPEMSETDKLSWLVLGRAPDALGRTDTALLQRAAIALLSGEEAGPTDALIRRIGLDELSVRQSDNGDVRDTVVSLGKQLSDRWYLGYERSVNATSGTWQLIYRVAQRFTLRAQSGLENALDAIWIWRRP